MNDSDNSQKHYNIRSNYLTVSIVILRIWIHTPHSGPRRILNGSRHSLTRSKLAAACLDDDGISAFEDSKPHGPSGVNGRWSRTACETAGGTFIIGLQRSQQCFFFHSGVKIFHLGDFKTPEISAIFEEK